jgi:anti-sigma factor RsiW
MSDCPNGDIRDLLPDFMHGRLDAAEQASVEAHLRDCELCREELALLRELRGALRRAPRADAGRIAAAIPPYRSPVRQVSWRQRGGWRIAAAITLLAAGGTSVAVIRHGAHPGVDGTRMATVRAADTLPGSVGVAVATTAPASSPRGASSATPAGAAPRELALAGGTIGDLDDRELSALIDDIGSLDAVPSVEVDNPATLSPIAPISPSGMNN